MKYEIIWHDCQDDRSGNPFTVEADSLREAYFKACNEIKSWSDYLKENFHGIDLEYLIDEDGKYHDPDYFLGDDKDV